MTHKDMFVRAALESLKPHLEKMYDQAYSEAHRAASENIRSKLDVVLSGAIPQAFVDSTNHVVDAQTAALNRKGQETVRESVLRVIRESRGGVLPKDIVAATGLNNNSVRGMLWSLNKEGQLAKNDQEKWVLKQDLFG